MNRPSIVALALLGALLASAPAGVGAQDQSDKQQELEQVRKRIDKLRGRIDSDVRKRDKLGARLRDIERLLGSVRGNLARLRAERESSEARRAALLEQLAAANAELEAQQGALGGQLRAAYLNGRQERLKMLLNQRDAAAVGRQSVYYRYLVTSRVEVIRNVESQLAELVRIEAGVAAETEKLRQLESSRAAELKTLEQGAERRRLLVAELEKQIDERGSQLSHLQQQEQVLVRLLDELQRVLAEFPVEAQRPFSSLKGKLDWPIRGAILGNFGEARAGKAMTWNGVLIGAERGTPVRAIAHGRVAYADWLPGLGLLLVIEHGDGFLSLYGHNERLDKAAGDWVDAGEMVAAVGNSGGQPEPALYLEIRRQRTPLNPHRWFAGPLNRS